MWGVLVKELKRSEKFLMSILWSQIEHQEIDGKKSTADVSEVVYHTINQQWNAVDCSNWISVKRREPLSSRWAKYAAQRTPY